jgi:hypothetical protein
MCERGFQAPGKFRIGAPNFAKQAIRHDPEGPQEFRGVELSDQRVFELRCHSARQLIDATAVGRRKAVANASQSQRVVADTTDHVFGLPQLLSCNAAPGMECVQPTKTDDVRRLRWRGMSRLVRVSEQQAERWRQGSEFRAGDEGQIDLQSAGRRNTL